MTTTYEMTTEEIKAEIILTMAFLNNEVQRISSNGEDMLTKAQLLAIRMHLLDILNQAEKF